MARGKKYKAALSKVDKSKHYQLDEAVSLIKQLSFSKFDGTVDIAVNLGVDPRQADQNVRGAVALPHGLGKTVPLERLKGHLLAPQHMRGPIPS